MKNNPVSDTEIFMHKITYLRKKCGYSKKAMSKLLGIGIHSLNLIEKGEMPLPISVTPYPAFISKFFWGKGRPPKVCRQAKRCAGEPFF